MKNKKIFIPILIVFFSILIIVTLYATKNDLNINIKVDTSVPVRSVKAYFDYYEEQQIFYGTIEGEEISDLEAVSENIIKDIYAKVGDTVKKDQSLIKIDDSNLQIKLKQQKSELTSIESKIKIEKTKLSFATKELLSYETIYKLNEKDFQRQKTLTNSDISTQKNLDNSEKNLAQSYANLLNKQLYISNHEDILNQLTASKDMVLAQIDLIILDIQDSIIRSPYDGVIITLNASIGEVAKPRVSLVTVFNTSKINIRSEVPIDNITNLRLILKKENKVLAITNSEIIPITLDRISSSISQGDTGLNVFFSGDLSKYPLGQVVKIITSIPTINESILLPESAIYNEKYIYKINDNKLTPIEVVVLGKRYNENSETEILVYSNGILKDDLILISNLPDAHKDKQVTLVE